MSPAGSQDVQAKNKIVRGANAQPFLCNEMGPFPIILGNFQAIRGPLSGNFRQFSGDFRQYQVILENFGAHRARKKKTA